MASDQDAELQDWLALTSYHNLDHRRKCLSWWADQKAIDKETAELEEKLKKLNQRRSQLGVQLRDNLITESIIKGPDVRRNTNIDEPHPETGRPELKRCRSPESSPPKAQAPPAKEPRTTVSLTVDCEPQASNLDVLKSRIRTLEIQLPLLSNPPQQPMNVPISPPSTLCPTFQKASLAQSYPDSLPARVSSVQLDWISKLEVNECSVLLAGHTSDADPGIIYFLLRPSDSTVMAGAKRDNFWCRAAVNRETFEREMTEYAHIVFIFSIRGSSYLNGYVSIASLSSRCWLKLTMHRPEPPAVQHGRGAVHVRGGYGLISSGLPKAGSTFGIFRKFTACRSKTPSTLTVPKSRSSIHQLVKQSVVGWTKLKNMLTLILHLHKIDSRYLDKSFAESDLSRPASKIVRFDTTWPVIDCI